MRRPTRYAESEPLRYDYQVAHDALGGKTNRHKWSSDYDLCLLEKIAILFAILAPSLAVWWRMAP